IRALSDELQNPAVLSVQAHPELGLSVLNRFEMKELNTAGMYLKYPNRLLDCGFRLSTFGYDEYRISNIQLSSAKKVTSRLSLGANLLYYNESSILNDESGHYFSSDLGFRYLLTDRINIAVLFENILRSDSERSLFSACLGFEYTPYKHTSFLMEASCGEDKKVNLSVGVESVLSDRFILRAGLKAESQTPSFGIGYMMDKWVIESGFSFHSELGVSSIIGVRFAL
ncbi:MAG: hypothetical protein LBH12_02785, partial [Dysgonamonadaceae bacterium]|nr:hypothetical protein [Dysgonamonadaceae bacterium]